MTKTILSISFHIISQLLFILWNASRQIMHVWSWRLCSLCIVILITSSFTTLIEATTPESEMRGFTDSANPSLSINNGNSLIVKGGKVGVGLNSNPLSPAAYLDVYGGFIFESTNPGSTDVKLDVTPATVYIGGADTDINKWHDGMVNVRGNVKIQSADFVNTGADFKVDANGELTIKGHGLFQGNYFGSSSKLGNADKSIPVPAFSESPAIDVTDYSTETTQLGAGPISFASQQTGPGNYFDGSNFKAGIKGKYLIFARLTFVTNYRGAATASKHFKYTTSMMSGNDHLAFIRLLKNNIEILRRGLPTLQMAKHNHSNAVFNNFANYVITDVVDLDVGDTVSIDLHYTTNTKESELRIGDRTFTAFFIGK